MYTSFTPLHDICRIGGNIWALGARERKVGNLVELRGKKALNLNDLAELEEQFGSLDKIDLGRFAVVRKILWLVIRKDEPEISLEQVGERFNIQTMQSEVNKVLKASGLLGTDEVSEGKEEAAGEV
jgi:hypothetical protein